ncbi:unnamed protein product [Euphydryas editha]|uniref:Endonuclease/exonuclease/phosphatase domain-containing protein n=1 Tax=Euphydryas editha TaxID=104508 RepID=A0AAU9UDT7_EUPED|nr:unnamed protein product [Euphydryas editha]
MSTILRSPTGGGLHGRSDSQPNLSCTDTQSEVSDNIRITLRNKRKHMADGENLELIQNDVAELSKQMTQVMEMLKTFNSNQREFMDKVSLDVQEIKKDINYDKDVTKELSDEQSMVRAEVVNLKTRHTETEKKLESLESDMAHLKGMSQVLPATNSLESTLEEIKERELRSRNIIICGVSEQYAENIEERKNADRNEVLRITRIAVSDCPEPVKIIRLGKFKSTKNRPIKVIYQSQDTAISILRNSKNIKSDTIMLFSDQTPLQQANMKALKEELKRRMSNETWIKTKEEAKRIQIPGYFHYYNYRNSARGGGVSIFVHDSLSHSFIEEQCIGDNNFLLIHVDSFSLDIGAVYRKPDYTNLNDFLEIYSAKLSKIKRGIMFGDYNINLLNVERSTNLYNEVLRENGFKIINKIDDRYSTRETSTSKTIIDHVSANIDTNNIHLAIADTPLSDHKQLFLEIKRHTPIPRKVVTYEVLNYEKLRNCIQDYQDKTEKNSYTVLEEKKIVLRKVKLQKLK